jgi:hypothetical protein
MIRAGHKEWQARNSRGASAWNSIRAAGRGETKNPPCQSARRVSENLLRNSKSSLAVFYVEQVALNRHVSPQPQLHYLCLSGLQMSRAPWPRVWVSVRLRGLRAPWFTKSHRKNFRLALVARYDVRCSSVTVKTWPISFDVVEWNFGIDTQYSWKS